MVPAISVVVPTYNSAPIIQGSLKRLSNHLAQIAPAFEIVVVDDGSSDATQYLPWDEYREKYQALYLRSPTNEGKGAATRRGLKAAAGPMVFFTDVDLPIDLDAISTGINRLSEGSIDFTIGSRRMRGASKLGHSFLCRKLGSRAFNLGVRLLAVRGCSDTQCCLKGFTADALALILPRTSLDSFAFDVELIFLACQLGMTGAEYPVTWTDRRGHASHVRLLGILVSCLLDVTALRRRYPGKGRQRIASPQMLK